MKWSYDWLKQYLNTDLSAEQIADKLTSIGLEVENIYTPILPIAAKIVECVQHENSDHLHVLKVDDGSGVLRQVVCGAPNARVGLVSALAVPGCKIGDIEIQPGKLRGVESNGMMCSEKELGIGEDHSGIIELDESKEIIGSPISALKNTSSTIFDTSITPNRPDYLSVRGIALDLSAAGVGDYIAKNIKELNLVNGTRRVNLFAEKECPTYRFCEIHGIKNTKSNSNISACLLSAGINPKNAVVDATNYICYDMAQPMHCFDADKIVGDITVRMAKDGEKFVDLFGKEHELCEKDLVITDEEGILALAGVVGGERAATTMDTKNIILESAYFDPVSVRKTSKRTGVSSDSSYRYERGINPGLSSIALAAATKIITDVCGGAIVNVSCAGRDVYIPKKVKYNPALFEKKTGLQMDVNTQKEILNKLQFDVQIEDKDNWNIIPNPARVDIQIAENIVSELIRIYGYEKIGFSSYPDNTISVSHNDVYLSLKEKLASRGLNESMSFGFGNSKIEELLFDKPIVKIANPITVELDTARNNLLENLLIAVSNNEKRGFADVNLFEIGTVFDGDTPNAQHTSLCIVRSGMTSKKHWMGRSRSVDVFDVKADIVSLLGSQKFTISSDNAPLWVHPYKYGAIVQGKKVLGEFGQLHPSIAKQLHIKTPVMIALINDIENIPSNAKYKKIPVTDFMPITRDFAFIVDNSFPAEKVISTAIASDKNIADAIIFDAFDMGDGKKSIAFTITIYPEKNMDDTELLSIQNTVISNVEKKCNAQIRDK